jgi:hypothetical protein
MGRRKGCRVARGGRVQVMVVHWRSKLGEREGEICACVKRPWPASSLAKQD